MTTDRLKNVILEAVDCLRLRKCRPDRESIAVYVMRKLGSSMNEIFSEIENTVDQGLLLKVEYKGSTSYRSPKNFDLKNSPLLTKHSKILNSSKTTRYVISGMNELLSTFPNYSQMGIPYDELKKKLAEFDKERFAEEGIKVIFEREEGAGSIQVAESDDPIERIRIFPKDMKVPDDMKLITFSEDTNVTPDRKKRKRPKKSEDSNESPKSSGSNKKEKQSLVYAVKSDPHKLALDNIQEEEAVKAKVQQISSIGLKVISEKGIAKKMGQKAKNGLSAQDKNDTNAAINDLVNGYDKKPSLTLVKVDIKEETKLDESTQNKISGVEGKQVLSNKPKTGKRKSDVTQQVPKSIKKKKLKLEAATTVDSDDAAALPRTPPRYTYASKKRIRPDEDEETEDIESPKVTQQLNGHGHLGECAYCKQEKNAAGDSEDFLSCGTCNAKVHATCIAYSEDHAKRLRMNSDSSDDHLQWQCFSCKRCGVCRKALMSSKNGTGLKKTKGKISKKTEQRYILCDHCDRGYHVKCVTGSLPLNQSSWFCGECNNGKFDSVNENHTTTKEKIRTSKKSKVLMKPTKIKTSKKKGEQVTKPQNDSAEALPRSKIQNGEVASSAKPNTKKDTNSSNVKSDEEVPDISRWTPAQVQKYFTEKGLQDEATSLREQEIDGMSLLLLRRADVIFGLNLRLGPALKIYRLVCQLQQHSSALKKKGNSESQSAQTKC